MSFENKRSFTCDPKEKSDENFNLLERFKVLVKKVRGLEFKENSFTENLGETQMVETKEKFLTASDEYIFKKGLKVLYDHLDQKTSDQLPKILLFPETSARVLTYIVMPAINYLYKKHMIRSPEFVFVKTSKQNTEKPPDEDENKLKKRMNGIYKHYDLPQETRSLIIDDFVAHSHTIDKIRKAIKKIDSNAKIEAFAFIAESPGRDAENGYLSGIDFWGNSSSISFLDDSNLKEKAIGVIKENTENEAFVRISKKRDPLLMRQIRKELKQISEDFLKEIIKQNNKSK